MTSTSDEVGHTATPWFVDGDGINRLIRGADQTIVAKRHRLPREIHSANFALIVNAVNSHDSLVKALELILPLAKGYSPNGQTAQAKATCHSWVELAEDALSQAKGGK